VKGSKRQERRERKEGKGYEERVSDRKVVKGKVK
jgi:hypothetical protein